MIAWASLALGGCASSDKSFLDFTESLGSGASAPTSTGLVDDTVRIDVFPSTTQDADGTWRALPQTAAIVDRNELGSVRELRTASPVQVTGVVVGTPVAPWRDASLPTTPGPVDALLSWTRDDALESSLAGTDADGNFATWMVPSGGRYTFAVSPTDPMIPPWVSFELITTAAEPLSVDLGTGIALWGTVSIEGASPEGMRVRAVQDHTVATAEALVDAAGWYQLRVPAGPWTVESLGRAHGLDPVLRTDVEVGDLGSRVDFDYGNLAALSVRGRVTAAGTNLDLATVRFSSTALPGLAGASLEVEAVTKDGNVNVTLAPGTYTMEVHPNPSGPAWTPARIENVAIVDGVALDIVDLQPAVPTTFLVVGQSAGDPLPDTVVTCTEMGFGARQFQAETDQEGNATMDLPDVSLECTFLPPDEAALPRLRLTDLRPAADVAVTLPDGFVVSGVVLLDGVPEPYAVVELRDGEDGSLIGAAVSDDLGSFAARVP